MNEVSKKMKMADFKILDKQQQLTILNNHLITLKGLDGRLRDNFKSGEFDFSFALLKKNADDLGLVIDGKNYVAYAASGELPVVEPQQIVVNKDDASNQISSEFIESQLNLTTEEIIFVKQLFAESQLNKEQQFIVNDQPMLVVPTMSGKKKTKEISVYSKQWERWGKFKKQHSMYSGTDLLAMALQEFMDKYNEKLN